MSNEFQIVERHTTTKAGRSYSYCAVVELDPVVLRERGRTEPGQISLRSPGVVRIVWQSDPYPTHGTTPLSARGRALDSAAKTLASAVRGNV
jgi:hypothetical protein